MPICFDITDLSSQEKTFQTLEKEICQSMTTVLKKINGNTCPVVLIVRKNGHHFMCSYYECINLSDNFLEVLSQARDVQEISKGSMRNQFIGVEQNREYEESVKVDLEKRKKAFTGTKRKRKQN